jgi:eukaryotic-like serine/threonine-protein kinase
MPSSSDQTSEPEKEPFAAGEVFAGRYRMITRIGRGEMGDVWRADDLVLETPVALKVIHSSGSDVRGRILDEVRLARQITHPAVCRVFDVGEAAGAVFYSMELVRGENLSTLLKRVGRMPSERVIDIGCQLCTGLAAAHAQGVLHRDLKPANILIDNDGLVRITDFGIVMTPADPGSQKGTGTPGYMAPEQRRAGAALSERTDVYALGLVLYELVVGQHPFERDDSIGQPPRPSTVVANVHPQLERVIMHALLPVPGDRPSSALEMGEILESIDARDAAWLSTSPASVRLIKTRWLIAAAVAVAAMAVLVVVSFVRSPGTPALTEQDTIMLADFENTTGEPVFDGALKVALAVALEQSPFLKVFPDERARETLLLMKRSPDERVTRAIAREIARRERLKALLVGSIATLGRNYVLALEAINAETGDVMAREQAEAGSKEQVLTSLGTATSRLREKLGESLASIQKYDVALPRATTASLEALHAYALALDEGRLVPRLEALPHLRRAIELDPNFAMAQALLSAVYANTYQSALAPEFSRKAFDLRDRVSERERFYISWRYYRDAEQAWDKALDLARSWTTTYPREAFAFNSLGSALIRLGRYEQSVEPFREAIRLDPRFVPPYGNLGASLMALSRFDESKAVLQQAFGQGLDFIGAHRISYLLAFIQGDTSAMARHLDSSVGLRQTNQAFAWQASASAFAGRMRAAHEQFHRGVQMSLQGEFKEVASQLTMQDAEAHATVGECGVVRAEVTAGLQLSRDNETLERASRALALCGAGAEAMSLSTELATRFPQATVTQRISLPVTAAMLAGHQGQTTRVLGLLEPVRPYDHAPSALFWPAYLRGQAYLKLKDGQAASVQFQSIVENRGEVPASALFPLAHLGLARAATLANDTAKARKAYEDFFALWNEADPGLQQLKDARQEYARLR